MQRNELYREIPDEAPALTPERKHLRAGIPRRVLQAGVRLEDYEVTERHGSAAGRDAVAAWLRDLDHNITTGHGMLLWGRPGTGKSMLASIALAAALDADYSGAFLTAEQYVRMQRDLLNLNNATHRDEERQVLSRRINLLLNKTQVVVLDDMGKEHTTASGFAESELDYLLRARYDNALVTIVTSNHDPEVWATRYSLSMLSMFYGAGDVVKATAPMDYRRRPSLKVVR